MLSLSCILILVLTILRCHLSKENKNFNKNSIALLINSNRNIEKIIPINQQKQKLIEQYSIPIQTEIVQPCVETNQDYYQAILSMNDIPYFPVRETTFEIHPRLTTQMIIDLKKGNYESYQQ